MYTGFSTRISAGSKTSGIGSEGINVPRAKGMTLGWVYRSVPHLGDSYNLDQIWGKYLYNYDKNYTHSEKKGGNK